MGRYTPRAERDAVVRAANGYVIGQSEQGTDIWAVVIGSGPRKLSLISGNHSDEPVGSETLRVLIAWLSGGSPEARALCERFTFVIVPHTNPDGEDRQREWMGAWPDGLACLRKEFREKPGRDVEFGYPRMRVENRAVSALWREHGPFAMHVSLHGMTASEGGYHLIERGWVSRTAGLREAYAGLMEGAGLKLFDWDRAGEKGFDYIGPGFATTPRSDAMRAHFVAMEQYEIAEKFHLNSMEYVHSLGGDPLCMVTELPLFVVKAKRVMKERAGVPVVYRAFREAVTAARQAMAEGRSQDVAGAMEGFEVKGLPIDLAVRLQLKVIGLGLEAISSR